MSKSIDLAEPEQEHGLPEDVFSAAEISDALDGLPDGALTRLERIAKWLAWGRPISPDDLLQEAVLRTLDGIRKCPRGVSLITFLVGVMKSIVSASLKSALTDPLARRSHEAEGDENDVLAQVKSEIRNPLQMLVAAEDVDRMLAELTKVFNDDPPAELVLLGLCQGMTPEEIRTDLKLDETGYATIRRRIRRRIDGRYPDGWKL